jgi:hypothetical protein
MMSCTETALAPAGTPGKHGLGSIYLGSVPCLRADLQFASSNRLHGYEKEQMACQHLSVFIVEHSEAQKPRPNVFTVPYTVFLLCVLGQSLLGSAESNGVVNLEVAHTTVRFLT